MSVIPVGMGSSGGYEIPYSLRLRASNSAYLSRTFGSPTDNKKWTLSTWIKRGTLGATNPILDVGDGTGNNVDQLYFNASDQIDFLFYRAGTSGRRVTSMVFRDPTAWLHIVAVADIANATAGSRMLLYVNGVQVTSFTTTTDPLTTLSLYANGAYAHYINKLSYNTTCGDKFHSETYFIDGQALTPSSFGETNSDGVWVPKKYTGTYGTNGFYLDFKDGNLTSGSNAGLGKDVSGNGNYWNTNGISVTAGTGYDWFKDTPTLNFPTGSNISPLASGTLSDGNMHFVSGNADCFAIATQAASSGKYYWEVVCTAIGAASAFVGIAKSGIATNVAMNSTSSGTAYSYYAATGNAYNGSSGAAYGNTYTTGDVIGVAFDATNGKLWFSKNGTWQNSGDPAAGTNPAATSISGDFAPAWGDGASASAGFTAELLFGQAPLHASATYDSASGGYFRYTPPTGFKALATNNLPAVTITNPRKHFDVVTRNGFNGTGGSITSLQFKPGLWWEKRRNSTAENHILVNEIVGVGSYLSSNTTSAEAALTFLTSLNSNGYTLATNDYAVTDTIVDWCWKANGAGVSNTDGSITSTVSANTTAGFSIVTYTGTTANATVGHGLGQVPALVIIKNRTGSANNWPVWHKALTGLEYLFLNLTDAKGSNATVWNSTTPTSTVFSIGSASTTNPAQSMVAYCFAPIAGFSAMGSYTGNGSADGPYVHCGFRPRYVLIKCSASVSQWMIYDTARDTYNAVMNTLKANQAEYENQFDTGPILDVTASGFKIRKTGTNWNDSVAYIYAAFAEFPNGSNVAPSPAR